MKKLIILIVAVLLNAKIVTDSLTLRKKFFTLLKPKHLTVFLLKFLPLVQNDLNYVLFLNIQV